MVLIDFLPKVVIFYHFWQEVDLFCYLCKKYSNDYRSY